MSTTSRIQSGFADVNGAKLFFEVAGEGSPLVLLHAGVADNTMWDGQFELFAQNYRVVRYDHRGFGRSEMPPGPFALYKDLAGLLDFLGIEKAHLCGVSIGGSAVVDFALAYPDRVAALIPVAAGLSGTPPDRSLDEPLEKALEEAYEARDIERVIDLEDKLWLVGPNRGPDAVAPALHEHFRKMERNNLELELAGEQGTPERLDPPAYDRLSEIHAPTLVIVGESDLPDVLAACERLATQVAGARKVVLPDTAHMVPMERPDEFNRIVLDFLLES